MHPEEKLFGFDVREMWETANWSHQMKDTHLLRHDIKKVLSTDRYVWPNVFDASPELVDYPLPSRNRRAVYDNIDIIKYYLTRGWHDTWKPCWIIALTVVLDFPDQAQIADGRMPYAKHLEPVHLDPAWALLGYDIADNQLLSGLSDCAYKSQDRPALRTRWGPSLNEYHLFSDREEAIEFRNFTDMRVPEDAPFIAYGLYSVEKHEGQANL